ncbi:hypothetical protein ATEIFO6365_0015000600 [Aspergillus terreus]|uniref:Uncharacterized protein n=1 Tax=Aspergillus terreus TaxID=33178 RepID=A0A5M3ZGQ5_ASPTE|nr:hypothetical protein ATETN484_0016000600 [Aspergillus terreus]GFF21435.1 hypothetical protein ATEIFO6365_0015000600 [Aspergillus terreus]
MAYTIEFVNASGSSGKVYNVFSAKTAVEGGANTPATVKSVVWYRSPTLSDGQREWFKFDNSFYGFLGSKRGTKIFTRENKAVTIASNMYNGSILLLDRESKFTVYEADDEITLPDTGEFKIATNASLVSENNVIGVSRGKEDDDGNIVPAPVTVVDLKPNVTYTFKTNKAVYIKATNFPEGTIQTGLDDSDKKAVKVEFAGQMKKAVVTEDSSGAFTVTYTRGG